MKKKIAKTLLLRVSSPLVLLVLCSVSMARGDLSAKVLCAYLIASSSILLFYPQSYETVVRSVPYVAGQAALYVAVALSPFFAGNECQMMVLACIPGLIAYTVMRSVEKYGNVKVLFRVDAIWCAVEEGSRMIYLMVLGILSLSALTACRFEAPAWVFFLHVFLLIIYLALSYMRAYSGRTFLIGLEREKAIRRVIQGNLRSSPEYGGPDDHMNMIYGKVLRFMESHKPYLKENFTIDELAQSVFSNKLYLSRAINYYSGRNFRQFVNYYRIMHATSLMKKDRHLKMTELAFKCGFHSVVSFNMAFKLYMNMTPSAYYGLLASKQGLAVTA